MTTTTTSNVSTSTVDELLAAIADGCGVTVADLYADDAVLDATVPGWRFHVRGSKAIAHQYGEWFADRGHFEELHRRPTADGEVVTYFLTWEEDGVPHAAHHCHALTIGDDGRITGDTIFCGGRWNATLLAAMQEADDG